MGRSDLLRIRRRPILFRSGSLGQQTSPVQPFAMFEEQSSRLPVQ